MHHSLRSVTAPSNVDPSGSVFLFMFLSGADCVIGPDGRNSWPLTVVSGQQWLPLANAGLPRQAEQNRAEQKLTDGNQPEQLRVVSGPVRIRGHIIMHLSDL
jgi:hypothetical protein